MKNEKSSVWLKQSSADGFRLGTRELQSRLLGIVASRSQISRSELAHLTELSRSSVALLVEPLIAARFLIEQNVDYSGRGRPSTVLALNPAAGAILVADLGATHARLIVANLGQRVVAEERFKPEIADGPEAVLTKIVVRFKKMLAQPGAKSSRLLNIVFGLPCPVDFERGIPVRPPIMPGWDGFPIAQFVNERMGVPVLVDNDANMLALGEARSRPPDQSPLLFVKVATGIGAGIVTRQGELHRGADGSAGDIGHIRVPGHETVACRCGNMGCVEAVASVSAMVRSLRAQTDLPIESSAEFCQLVGSGDERAVRLVRTAATQIGEIVADLVHFYNPATIVLGGRLASLSDDLLAGIRAVVYQRALPLATRHLVVENTRLGGNAAIAGGMVLGIEEALSAASLERLLPKL